MATAIPEGMEQIDLTIIEMMMVKEAKKVLQDTILQEMDKMLTKVAIEAVKGFAEVKTRKEQTPFGIDYHVHFMQKVVKTIQAENPTVVVHNDNKS